MKFDSSLTLLAGGLAALLPWLLLRIRGSTTPASSHTSPVRKLRELKQAHIPVQLQVAHYVDLVSAERRGFLHVAYLRAAHDVAKVLDGLHAYTVHCIEERAARLPVGTPADQVGGLYQGISTYVASCACVGRHAVTLGEGATFSPERIIGSERGEHALHVGAGARLLGGAFDLSEGGIWLGKQVLICRIGRCWSAG